MLTVSDMTKQYGGRTLFAAASLQVNRGERLGIVGPNGAGKSTLFSLILGNAEPDDGTVVVERNAVIGHLPQETAPIDDETVLDLAMAITPEIQRLQQQLKEFEAGRDPAAGDYHEIQTRYEALGGYQLEPRARQILQGLAFRESDFHRPLRTMSGGWVMRAHLARLLVQEPDLLMLDEPTNHLDLEALRWLEDHLQNYRGAILLISHDRQFLNQLVGSILEIRHAQLVRYRGNYDTYLVQRAARAEQHQAAYENQQREIQRLQRFADRFRAKASKATQAQAKLRQIERMEKIEAPQTDEATIRFRFPQPARSGLKVITLNEIQHAYGDNIVYRGVNVEVERGQRIVLVGPNGAGKSTLLKLLAGVLPVQQGRRVLGSNVDLGYYAQHRIEVLDPKRTVLEEALDTPQLLSEQSARTVLGSFLFRGDNVHKQVGVLSGGEKSRLALVKLLLDPPNLLLMDEPTTHLDLGSVEALIQALQPYRGTLIFISHDEYFIHQLAGHVLHINAGQLTHYHGDYQYYLDRVGTQVAEPATTSQDPVLPVRAGGKSSRKEQKRAEAEARQALSRQRRVYQQKLERLEREIERLESEQQRLTKELEDPSTYENAGRAVAVNRDLMHVQEDLERLTAEWEQLAGQAPESSTV